MPGLRGDIGRASDCRFRAFGTLRRTRSAASSRPQSHNTAPDDRGDVTLSDRAASLGRTDEPTQAVGAGTP